MAEPKIEEADVDFTLCTDIAFKQLKNSVELTLSDRLPDEIAANASIFVVSNTYGYFIAGQNEGFLIDKLSSLRSAFENGEVDASNDYNEAARVEISGETISHIRLSADELTVIVGLRGGMIHLYSVTKLLAKTKGAKPIALLDLGSEILDIRPNPSVDKNGLMAVLLDNRTIRMINAEDGSITAILDKHKYTAMAWSSKGKQIMCGTENGRLYQIDPEGALKKEHLPNPDNDGHQVTTIAWLETAVFIVVYSEQPGDDGTPSFISDFCVISKEDKTKPTKFTRYRELCFPMPNDICGINYYISSSLKNLSKNYKEFMVAGYSASTDIATIARGQDGEWMLLDLPEVDRPMVTGSDPCMLGMAIDLTATKHLEPLEEEGPEVPAAPILYVYNNHGQLSAYNILELSIAKQGLPNGAMVQPKALPQAASSTKAIPAAKATPIPKTAPKAASATPSVAKVAVSPAAPSAEVKTSSGVSFDAAVAASAKPGVSPSAGYKTGAPAPSAFTVPTPKVSFGAPTSAFGSFPSSPTATSKSFAPNPVVNPNPAFQQNTAAPPKPLGTMQKILQENDPPLRIVRKKSVADAPSAPASKVSAAMDALSRQLENTYLAMTEELKTLHSHVRETEELVKAREHVFGELDQFMLVTEKRIKAAEKTKVLAESVSKDFVNLQTDLVKVTTKREEIGKLLKAREDPSLLEKVLTSELNPAQAAMQDHMARAVETIDSRLRDLEKHVEAMNTEANKLRQGQYAEHPTLDSIRRSIRHISTALISRQSDLDQLSNDLDNLAITESISPQHGSTSNVSAKGSVATQNKDAFHLKSFSSVSGHRSTEQSKTALARELRRVFTADSKSTAILNAPGSTAAGTPLSVLPKLKEVEFVPVFEPRRSERKRRLAAAVAPQPEVSAIATSLPSVPASVPVSANPVQSFAQSETALGSSPAPAIATMVSTPSPAFGFKPATSPVPTPAFGIPQTSSPFGSAPTSAKLAPAFGTPSVPDFGATPAAAAPMSFGAPKTPTFHGFQVPKSEPSAAPAFSGFQVPKSEPSAAPAFAAAPSFSAAPTSQSVWGFSKTSTPSQSTGFAGFQVPSVDTGAKVTLAPAFSFAKPVQQEEEEEEADGEEEQYEPQDDDEEEYEDEEEGHYNQARYEHDGQVYDLEDDGSEPETWGSDTDQRDFDQGEENGEEDEGEEGPYEEEDREQSEGEATPAPVSSEKKDPSAKSAWAAPGFSFPATAPAASAPAADSSKPAFSFFTAAAKQPKESDVKADPVAQSPFGTTGTNTFGSTTAFAFGTPQSAPTTPAPVSTFGQKHSAPTTAVPKPTPIAREPVKTQESDDEEEDLSDDEQEDLPDEEQEESEVEDEQDDEQEELGSEVEEEGGFDEDGSEVEEGEDAGDDSDKESALTAVQRKGSFAPSTASGAKSSSLESSGLDFSKVGFGGSAQKGGDTASPFAMAASSASGKPLFGATPAFGSASDANATPAKNLDMPFVKLPRTRKESRDSLDSNTTDDEDQAVPSSEPSSPVLSLGKASKGISGGLDSFNLSLGGEQVKTDKKPAAAWGESSFSSWGSASQTSVAPPTSAWGSSSILGSSQPVSSASPFTAVSTSGPGASASPFAAAAPLALTSTPASSVTTTTTTAWGTSGSFGQTSTLGSGFGGNATGFGQTSQAPATTASGFGQVSQLGSTTGFGQTSTPGAGTSFGQTSTLGAGTGFGQTSTVGSGFGQTSALGADGAFGQTSTLGAGTGFGQTSQPGSGSAFGQVSQLGGGTAFGQKSQMGGGFGQTAFGQPSQIAGGAFGTPAASGIASASTQSNFGAFASSGTNAFAAASQSKVNALDQQAGGSVFGSGSGFGDSGTSTFGSGGGRFGGGNTGFGGASTGFGGATNNAFGGASNNTGGFGSFGGAAAGGGGGFGVSTGQSAFGAAAGQGGSVFGQGGSVFGQSQANTGFGSNQTNTGFGTSQANINPNKPAFSSFR